MNVFSLCFRIHNDGDARATGVRVRIEFPDDLLTLSEYELEEYMDSEECNICSFSSDDETETNHKAWRLKFFSTDEIDNNGDAHIDKSTTSEEIENKFISLDELTAVGDIANLLDPSYFNGVVSIYAGEVTFDKQEVRHKEYNDIDGLYVLPTKPGRFVIKCRIISNEYPEAFTQDIIVEVK